MFMVTLFSHKSFRTKNLAGLLTLMSSISNLNTWTLFSDSKASFSANSKAFFCSPRISDLLTAIHLENLTSVFVLNGYDTTEDIRQLSVDDLDYLGIDDSSKDIILRSVGKASATKFPMFVSRKLRDSGFHSSDSDISTPSLFMPKESDENTQR